MTPPDRLGGDAPEVGAADDGEALPSTGGGTTQPIGMDRLAYVDFMRTIAVLRVVVSHAIYWPWLKWFESLPVMFFVSGTLVGRSLRTRSWKAVLWGRVSRLAAPTAVYVVFDLTMRFSGVLLGTNAHLWYITTFIFFVAISGVIRWLVQRAALATVVVLALVIVVLTAADANYVAVSAAYQLSWVCGMIWAERDCEVPPTPFLIATAVGGFLASFLAVGYWLGIGSTFHLVAGEQVSPSTLGISMAGLGAAWLAVGMLFRHQLEAAMHLRGLGSFVRYLNRRLLTIYLWHMPATLIARNLAADMSLQGAAHTTFVLAVTFVLTALATVALGGLEDRASAASKRVKARAEAQPATDP